jgi:hypothetical protein
MSYEMLDEFLRNNLDDDDYAEYSAALDSVHRAVVTQGQVLHQLLNILGPTAPECCGCAVEWQAAIDLIKKELE